LLRPYCFLLLLGFVSGCSVDAIRKEPPIALELPSLSSNVRYIPAEGGVHTVDLGSLLFRKVVTGVATPTIGITPVGLQALPGVEGWVNSWTYIGADAPNTQVFTHEQFFHGALGVLVGSDGLVKTSRPIVQVAGSKKGRRWAASGGPEFVKMNRRIETWALRYGGEREDGHRFLIVDFADDKEREVAQDFRVSNEDGRKGFSVKGVRVRILSYGGGRVTYTFSATSADDGP
jgi:hypothetical protein